MRFRLSRFAFGLVATVSMASVALAGPAYAGPAKGDPLAAHAAAASAPAGFSVASVAPSSGTASGGTLLRITGSGFSNALGVVFGDFTPADYGQNFGVDSDSTLDVTTPPHTSGPVDVTVVTPSGNIVLHNGYTYAKPTVTAVAPATGVTGGGTRLTLTGTGFANAIGVVFGDFTPADYGKDFGADNDNTIEVTTPPHLAGTVDVTVVTPSGNIVLPHSYDFVERIAVTQEVKFDSSKKDTPFTVTCPATNPYIDRTVAADGDPLAITGVTISQPYPYDNELTRTPTYIHGDTSEEITGTAGSISPRGDEATLSVSLHCTSIVADDVMGAAASRR